MKPAKVIAAAGAALALAAATATSTLAATSTAIPPGTLHGCVVGTSRVLENVYANNTNGTTCAQGFQAVWPAGPDSDPQPQQQVLTAGPGGLAVTIQTSAAGAGQAVITCPAGFPYALGGGGDTGDGNALAVSEPVFSVNNIPDGWEVITNHANPSDDHATASVICSR